MKLSTVESVSASRPIPGVTPIRLAFGAKAVLPRRSGLVEEAALQQARPLLGADLDIAGRQQEDLVGNALHAALERVGQAACEVDQPLRELGVSALQVQDHRNQVLELVRDLLRVVEAPRDDEVDARRGGAGGS